MQREEDEAPLGSTSGLDLNDAALATYFEDSLLLNAEESNREGGGGGGGGLIVTPYLQTASSAVSTEENHVTPTTRAPSLGLPFSLSFGQMYPHREIDFSEIQFDNEPIGRGAFGTVYRATWRGAQVAVKRLNLARITEVELEQIRREASLMASLGSHPNVLESIGVCTKPPNVCLVSPYHRNGSIHDYLKAHPNVDWLTRVGFARDAAAGVFHTHCEHIVHRDLAARNFLLDGNLVAMVSDFGLSRLALAEGGQGVTGTNFGPVKHMAPESIVNRVYSQKSDAFSFGVFLYELVTMQEPYPEESLLKVALEVVKEGRRPVIPSDCPPVFRDLMTRCWKEDPEERPGFAEILEILETYKRELLAQEKAASEEAVAALPGSSFEQTIHKNMNENEFPSNNNHNNNKNEQEKEQEGTLEYYMSSDEHLHDLVVKAMNTVTGFNVQSRRWHLKTYPCCFVASEAVDWLLQNTNVKTRAEAVQLGDRLVRKKIIVHVVDQDKRFQDDYFFYRFVEKAKLVVIGGGFAGSTIAKRLERNLDVTLIDTKSYFEFVPSFIELATAATASTSNNDKEINERQQQNFMLERVRKEHTSYLGSTEVVVCKEGVSSVTSKEVILMDGRCFRYNYLCICTGSRYDVAASLGLSFSSSSTPSSSSESSEPIASPSSKDRRQTQLEKLTQLIEEEQQQQLQTTKKQEQGEDQNMKKEKEEDKEKRRDRPDFLNKEVQDKRIVDCRSAESIINASNILNDERTKHIVIVGGGPTAVELLGELTSRYSNKHFTLVCPRSRLLHRMPASASAFALQHFQKHFANNVTFLFHHLVVGLTNDGRCLLQLVDYEEEEREQAQQPQPREETEQEEADDDDSTSSSSSSSSTSISARGDKPKEEEEEEEREEDEKHFGKKEKKKKHKEKRKKRRSPLSPRIQYDGGLSPKRELGEDQHQHFLPQLSPPTRERRVLVKLGGETKKSVPADLIYAAVGFAPNTEFLRRSDSQLFASALNERGEVRVNPFFQVGGMPNVFALGDIVSIETLCLPPSSSSLFSSSPSSSSSFIYDSSSAAFVTRSRTLSSGSMHRYRRRKQRSSQPSLSSSPLETSSSSLSSSSSSSPSSSFRRITLGGLSRSSPKGETLSFSSMSAQSVWISEEKLASNAERHAEVVAKNIKHMSRSSVCKLRSYTPICASTMMMNCGCDLQQQQQQQRIVSLGRTKSMSLKGGAVSKTKTAAKFRTLFPSREAPS
ncbi:DEP domain-containing protein [Balamuthia mandrillaris]